MSAYSSHRYPLYWLYCSNLILFTMCHSHMLFYADWVKIKFLLDRTFLSAIFWLVTTDISSLYIRDLCTSLFSYLSLFSMIELYITPIHLSIHFANIFNIFSFFIFHCVLFCFYCIFILNCIYVLFNTIYFQKAISVKKNLRIIIDPEVPLHYLSLFLFQNLL